MMQTLRFFPFFVLAVCLFAAPGLAQEPDTRAEKLLKEREEKSKSLQEPESPALERFLLDLENGRIIERFLNPPEGIYPRLGNITAGSGISVGPGWRQPGLFGGHADFQGFVAASFSKYWMAEARLRMPRLARERVVIDIHGRTYSFPDQEFFGLGPGSDRQNLSTYGLTDTVVGASATFWPVRWLGFGGGADLRTPDVEAGTESDEILGIFTPEQAPGVLAQPDFMQYQGLVEVNYRDPRGTPRRGGRYTLTYNRFADLDDTGYSFNKVEANVEQYVPILKGRRTIALRALASTTDADQGSEVPFYLLPTLGGPDDLRGFRRFRFRDRHALLLQAEYRWEIFTAVDGAIFYDAGKVASRLEDLDLRNLESDYGIGFRFGTVNGTFLRVEGAFGSTGGKHFILRFANVF